MEIVKVIVDRQCWHRGQGSSGSRLLITEETINENSSINEDSIGDMCCLGFACLALGCTKKEISNVTLPDRLTGDAIKKVSNRLVSVGRINTESYEEMKNMAHVNDRDDIDDTERESKLTILGKQLGLDMEFVN